MLRNGDEEVVVLKWVYTGGEESGAQISGWVCDKAPLEADSEEIKFSNILILDSYILELWKTCLCDLIHQICSV